MVCGYHIGQCRYIGHFVHWGKCLLKNALAEYGFFMKEYGDLHSTQMMHFWSGFSLLWCVLCSATQSCPTLCDPMDFNPPGSSVHGILQAKILRWVAISFSRASSPPRDRTRVPWIAGWFFTTEPLQHRSGPVFKSRLLYLGIVQISSSLNHLIFCCLPVVSTRASSLFSSDIVACGLSNSQSGRLRPLTLLHNLAGRELPRSQPLF